MFQNLTFPGYREPDALKPLAHGGETDAGLAGLINGLLEAISGGFGTGSSWNPIAGIEGLGYNVHPLLVHFPIAFLVVFLLAEIAGLVFRGIWLRHLAGSMLYLGAVGAVAAAGAGLIAEENVPHGAAVHEIMEWHERAGLTVAGLAVLLAVWRAVVGGHFSPMAQALHLFLAIITVACLFFGADLGGLMVYEYGVGVKSLQHADEPHQHHDHH